MSIETLDRVYGHHHPDYFSDAAEAIQTGTKRWLFHWLARQPDGKNSNESWWWRQPASNRSPTQIPC
jgi:hypothetical protein